MQGVLRQKAAPTNLDVYTVLGHVQRTHLIVKDMHFREISREAEMAEMRKAIAAILVERFDVEPFPDFSAK